MKLTDGVFSTTLSCVVNESYAYYVIFPESWSGRVTVLTEHPNEWSLVEYTRDGEDGEITFGSEVARVLVYAKSEYHDEFDTSSFDLIYESDRYEYYACVNYVGGDLQLTSDEFAELFVPISS